MPGIDPMVMQHHLSVDPKAKGVRHKCKSFSAKQNAAIFVEVDCLLAIGFIQETHYLN